ncbi:MAG TPA: response regulator, partial [Methylomirabilota bacterium]|nr:response regulator [Methylomirabilota bacterium]
MTSAGSILVIDSRAESRAALVRAVVEADYASLEAATAAEGLALLGSLHPQLVLLDIDHLDNALELARQIKLENADVPVLILSSSEGTDLVVKGMRAGAYDFLVKPVAASTLKNVFKAALTQSDSPAVLTPQGGNGSTIGQPALNLDLLFRNSERMRLVEDIVRRAADTNATILLQGESGTGKEMVA